MLQFVKMNILKKSKWGDISHINDQNAAKIKFSKLCDTLNWYMYSQDFNCFTVKAQISIELINSESYYKVVTFTGKIVIL